VSRPRRGAQLPDQPPELRQTSPHAAACVGHTLFWQLLLFLNELPLLQEQSNAPHSLALVHASPGFFGPVGPASGPPLLPLPVHPP
jgi:hypothetical protein